MKLKYLLFSLVSLLSLGASAQVKVAVFSLNDFHGAFVRNDDKGIAGAPSVWQTLDSLKKVYPYHLTVSGGDNFGGSYFYNATHGVLLPVFFNDLGIRISAVGNHEFDNGQRSLGAKWEGSPLRPHDWDITYVCANVRDNKSGRVPSFAQPVVSVPVEISGGKKVRIAFAGLIASSTPRQVSTRRIQGLSFDGRYDEVLDSVMRLPEASLLNDADIRLLLTHVGTRMNEAGLPEWDDADSLRFSQINNPFWNGIISAHTHKRVCGEINEQGYPVVQGRWHGDYIAMLLFTIDTLTMKVTDVEPQTIRVVPQNTLAPGPQRLQAQIDSLLQHTLTPGGTPIGEVLTRTDHEMPHDRDNKYVQTEVGELVCEAYAEAYRKAAALPDETVIVGVSHFGSIRAGFTPGDISVLDVGEALPFANKLKVYSLTGNQITSLVQFGLHNMRYGYIQTGNLEVVKTPSGNVTALIYRSPQGRRSVLQPNKRYYLVADEFMSNGGDGYSPDFFPTKSEVKTEGMPATTDAFINYLRGRDLND